MIREAIAGVVEGRHLSPEMARAVMMEMVTGAATPSQIASFITAMRMKGETEDELLEFARVMREASLRISAPEDSVDLCGTGGDGSGTFNISTASAFVAAAADVPVAKHGNSSVSSRCGSADVLKALGAVVDLGPQHAERCLSTAGMCFMFAPVFHPSMRNVLSPRREVGLRTFFNFLGPMVNPAGVKSQLIGVCDFSVADKMAGVLSRLGVSRIMIVNGQGMDEITASGPTSVLECINGERRRYTIRPEMFGIEAADSSSLSGGGPVENARAIMSVLRGERSPRADVVAMNAGAAVYISGAADSLADGVSKAQEVLRAAKAMDKLREFVETTRVLESERQSTISAAELRKRTIMPDMLLDRSAEIAESILEDVRKCPRSDLLNMLDPELISVPGVLTAIVLQRILTLSSKEDPKPSSQRRTTKSMADAIENAEGLALIAEYKPSSPLAGALSVPPNIEAASKAFAESGAHAVSVLAEPDFFSGGPELVSYFAGRLHQPILFKDFIVSTSQLEVARGAGADAVLLIAKVLSAEAMAAFVERCDAMSLEPLVEVHDDRDVSKLKESGCIDSVRMVGVNSRNLTTMTTDLRTLREIRPLLPSDVMAVAESGLRSPQDVELVKDFDAVLVGTMLMRSDDLVATLNDITSRCRGVLS